MTRIPLKKGRAKFDCPSCGERLCCGPEDTGHQVHGGDGKATISPCWCCPECYLVGRLKRGDLVPIGEAGQRNVPIGTRLASRAKEVPYRQAVTIDQSDEDTTPDKPLGDLTKTDVEEMDDDDITGDILEQFEDEVRYKLCPMKRKHGHLSNQGADNCPLCGRGFPVTKETRDFERDNEPDEGPANEPSNGDADESSESPADDTDT
jgi:hypothetical protein